jgi:lactate dehydrogenase-like 2-hydroxyacid dehydrogenase
MALLLGIARGVHLLDGAVKAGHWESVRAARPAIHGKRLGILGLGNIGAKIARRASGFDMDIGYHTRQPRAGLPYRHFPDALALATHSDYLVLACPGGQATRHLVDAAVLEALGPTGFLINIARGSVVDTAALVSALQAGGIAGAALDVFEGEPALPAAMRDLPNLLLTPHVSGRSPESLQAQIDMFLAGLKAVAVGAAPPHQVRP